MQINMVEPKRILSGLYRKRGSYKLVNVAIFREPDGHEEIPDMVENQEANVFFLLEEPDPTLEIHNYTPHHFLVGEQLGYVRILRGAFFEVFERIPGQ